MPLPSVIPGFSAGAAGSLSAGSYGVAYTIGDAAGEESPMGPLVVVELTTQGSILGTAFTVVANHKYRIYMTSADGEELYQVVESSMSVVSFLIGVSEMDKGGRQPATRFKEEVPYGHFVDVLRNRLLIARDNMVGWSEAFRPHLWDPRHNFVMMQSTITMMKAVNFGVYISDGKSVIVLSNEDPDKFIVQDVDADPAIYGTATVVPGAAIGSDADHAVIWLTRHGHIAGLPEGRIERLNPRQLNLPAYSVGSGTYIERKGLKQVIIPVNSEQREGPGTAFDTSI